jgi:hypothetical protein
MSLQTAKGYAIQSMPTSLETQTNRQTERQTNKPNERHTHTHTSTACKSSCQLHSFTGASSKSTPSDAATSTVAAATHTQAFVHMSVDAAMVFAALGLSIVLSSPAAATAAAAAAAPALRPKTTLSRRPLPALQRQHLNPCPKP